MKYQYVVLIDLWGDGAENGRRAFAIRFNSNDAAAEAAAWYRANGEARTTIIRDYAKTEG